MNTETHSLMDGKVHIYKRDNSRFWQCSTYLDGLNHRVSTKQETLTLAKEFAREWYMAVYVDSKRQHQTGHITQLIQKFGYSEETKEYVVAKQPRQQKIHSGPTFREAAEKFIGEYGIITQGESSPSSECKNVTTGNPQPSFSAKHPVHR